MWCSEVLEHVADGVELLHEVRRVLRPGGRLLVTVPFHGRVKAAAIALARFDAHFDPQGQHLRFYTRASLAATLRAAGLEPTSIDAAGGLPLLRESLVARARARRAGLVNCGWAGGGARGRPADRRVRASAGRASDRMRALAPLAAAVTGAALRRD